MAQITNTRQILTYLGPTLPLGTAPFLENIRSIYRYNSNGAFISFTRGSQFPNLTQLENGVGYIVVSDAVPYEIPTDPVRPPGGSGLAPLDIAFSGVGAATTESVTSTIYGGRFSVTNVAFLTGSGTLSFSLDGGLVWRSLADFNTVMASFTGELIPFRFKVAHSAAFSLQFTLTFP